MSDAELISATRRRDFSAHSFKGGPAERGKDPPFGLGWNENFKDKYLERL